MERKIVTTSTIKELKAKGQPLTMLTAYDYAMAKNIDEAGVDMILVGDSLGNVMLGYSSTVPVTMEEMLHHTKAVVRGTQYALVVGDMPFMSYQTSEQLGLENAGRLLKEGGCQAIKLEGGSEICPLVEKMVQAGIPVMGHIGLTPQSVNQFGGFKVQGKELVAAQKLVADAKALEAAGAFCIVIECVPEALTAKITELLTIPTIGIGAGKYCSGQVLVCNDLLGMSKGFTPKFVKKYRFLQAEIVGAVSEYITDVRQGNFPSGEHTFTIDEEVLEKIY
ncbi:MAG TPA: 3-methyl-2-oxobutanoate hydroxymethyltransferase [Candidatus Avacidaminococcus intestinavium]|uniref:3-methyl-2-oxobutanoate hydroxymethyltransferase n=1 Tax=Candidatus Avacidaminococcus intestinavium TaxID=2840684 RepID=A0A9D1MP80_9FIRM|nr:3-methyl-2-oxobutanoate hydroxymethyltransferase [Candidatus Avacidaminococcus intestinavium]